MKITLTAPLFCAALALCSPAAAQDAEDAEYRRMMDQAMKSGNYGQNQPENWDARLKAVSGSVMVKPSESEEWVKIAGEMPLDPGDLVKTASDGIAELYLDDKGAISVGRNTELEVTSLDQGDTVFSITFGSLAAKIKHFLNDKFKLSVRTPAAVCAVRGTEFAVEYSQLGKDTGVAVFDEGRLAVSPIDEKEQTQSEYMLEKNTELTFTPAQKRFRPVPLARMARYRTSIASMRLRLTAMKKTWKPLSATRKEAIRARIFKRNVIRKEIDNPGSLKKKAKRASRVKKASKSRTRRKARAPAPVEEP